MMTELCRKLAALILAKTIWPLLLFAAVLLPSTAHADNAQYFYDPGGRLIGMIDPTNGSATYSYDAAGNITSISRTPSATMSVVQFFPTTGPVGTSVTISGTAFTGGTTTVKFGTVTASPTSVTANQIVVPVPTGVTGAVSITISRTSPSGSFTTPTNFTVASPAAAPTITSFSPGTQVQGSSVTIAGANFDTANSKVFVNGQAAEITAATPTSLTINVPPGSSGKINVETPNGNATSTADLIIVPPGYAAVNVTASGRTTLGASPFTLTTGGSGTVSIVMFDVDTAGQRINTYVNQAAMPGCPTVRLLSPDGSTLMGGPICSSNVWFGPMNAGRAGTYSIIMAPTAAGSFSTSPFSVPADATGTVGLNGTTTSLTITTPGQHGIFTFNNATPNLKVSINLDFSGMTNWNTYVIVNPDGTYLLAQTDTGQNQFWPTAAAFTLAQTGTYQIIVVPDLNGGLNIAQGVMKATVFTVPANATGIVALNGTTSSISITTPGQQGTFTFDNTTANTRVSISMDFSGMANYVTYWIKNPDGTTFLVPSHDRNGGPFWVDGTTFVLAQTTDATHHYTVTIFPDLNGGLNVATGTTKMTIFTVPNNATATVGLNGVTSSLAIGTPGQQGTFTFDNTIANTRISISMDFSGMANYVTYWIKNPDGTTFLVPSHDQNGGPFWIDRKTFILAQTTDATHHYTVTIFPDLNGGLNVATGTTKMTIFTVPANATATVALNGVTSSLTIGTPGQQGTFTFGNTTANTVVTLSMDFSGMANYVTYWIMNPDGTTYLVPSHDQNGGPFFINRATFVLAQTTDATHHYTATIFPDMNGGLNVATGTTKMTAFTVPAAASAALTIGGGTKTVSIGTPGQQGLFTFSGTSGQKVSFNIDTSAMTTCGTLSMTNTHSDPIIAPTYTCTHSFIVTLPRTDTYSAPFVTDLNGGLTAGTGTLGGSVVVSP